MVSGVSVKFVRREGGWRRGGGEGGGCGENGNHDRSRIGKVKDSFRDC